MSKTPKNHGKSWTPSENAQVRRLADQNTPTNLMGIKLGRTEASVRSPAHEANASLNPTNQSPYNPQKK